jgi:biopolymer transport protein ExbD
VAFLRAQEDEDIDFQMAPMIDVVFLLLIFFLVAASFINPETQMITDLPQKQQIQEPPPDMPQQYEVTVTKTGILVNGTKMTKAQLRDQLISDISRREPPSVFVDAKDDAVHGNVVEILDMATDIGAKVTVRPPYEEKAQ